MLVVGISAISFSGHIVLCSVPILGHQILTSWKRSVFGHAILGTACWTGGTSCTTCCAHTLRELLPVPIGIPEGLSWPTLCGRVLRVCGSFSQQCRSAKESEVQSSGIRCHWNDTSF